MVGAFAEVGMHVSSPTSSSRQRQQSPTVDASTASTRGSHVDVTDVESVHALAEFADHAFGEVHVLCNNAGVLAFGKVAELRVEDGGGSTT